MPDDGTLHFTVDGERVTFDDLTYREKHEALRIVRDLTGNPEQEWDGDPRYGIRGADLMFATPAMIYLVRKRKDDSYTLDQALECKAGDYFKPASEKRPTQRKAQKTPAG